MPTDLCCPVCAEPLEAGERAFACGNRHSFDRARQGYVNLLRPTRLRGDTLEMLRARRRFLAAGWYAPLAEAICDEVGAWLAETNVPPQARALLDAGCGEGYYLNCLARTLSPSFTADGWRLYGMDLAKDAVRMAATLAGVASDAAPVTTVTWLVGNSKDTLPFGDAALGALLTIFAPRRADEFARTLTPGGLLLVVTPAEEHLAEARAALPWLLAPEPAKADRLRATLGGAFSLARELPVTFTLSLDSAALVDLATMTPHRAVESATLETAAHAASSRAAHGRLSVGVSCVVRSYQRRA